jgi:DNA-binding protein
MSEGAIEDPNIVYIGRKPVMSYVLAIITSFTGSHTSKVVLKARGRAISTAVDAAEVARRRFMQDLHISEINIGTEELPSESGNIRAVSTMNITLTRIPVVNNKEKEKSEEAEPMNSSQSIALTSIGGIGVKRAEQLRSYGIDSIKNLADCDAKDLSEKLHVSEKQVSTWIENAKKSL